MLKVGTDGVAGASEEADVELESKVGEEEVWTGVAVVVAAVGTADAAVEVI